MQYCLAVPIQQVPLRRGRFGLIVGVTALALPIVIEIQDSQAP